MLCIKKIRGPLIMAVLPLKKYDLTVKSNKDPNETPMDRIKKLFISTELEPISRELLTLKSFTTTAGVVGMIVGGILHTRTTVQKFVDDNQATLFRSQFDAKRQLQNTFSIQFIKGSWKFGWRTALFTWIFGFIQLLLTTYYGEPSVLHYVVGGGTAGFLFKLSLGLRGSLVGLLVGSILGGIGGFISLLTLNLAGLTLEDLYIMEQQWAHMKNDALRERMAMDIKEEFKEAKSLYDENKEIQKKLSVEKEEATN